MSAPSIIMSKTAEQIELEQALVFLNDKDWRMSRMYKIQTKDKKLITYKRKMAQLNYAKRKANKNLILKARQLGFTTECLIDFLDDTLFTPNTVTAIIAHEKDKVIKLFEIVKRAYENVPEMMRPRASLDNRNEIYFPELDSKIYVTMDARSGTVHNLHVSEAHFISHAETMLAGSLEAVPKGGKINLESTGNGVGGYFYEEWENEHSEFKKHFYNWLWDPDYHEEPTKTLTEMEAEYRALSVRYNVMPDIYERYDLTPEQFAWYISKVRRHRELVVQEYPTTALEAFLATGRNVFHMNDLQKHASMNPIDRKWGDLLIYEKPLKGFKYVMGIDPAEGRGGDNSVIEVFNAHTGEQAAEFASNRISPDKLADTAIEIGNMYNKALAVVEVNNHGHAVIQRMRTKYWNMYRREVIDKVTKEKHDVIGWVNSLSTKPLLVDNLEEAVREQAIIIYSEDLLKEMKVFVQTDDQGKKGYGAEGTAKDDRVIATGLCIQGIRETPRLKKPESIAEKKLKEYAARHGLPESFNNDIEEDVHSFPPDLPDPNRIVTHKSRPKVGIRGIS